MVYYVLSMQYQDVRRKCYPAQGNSYAAGKYCIQTFLKIEDDTRYSSYVMYETLNESKLLHFDVPIEIQHTNLTLLRPIFG